MASHPEWLHFVSIFASVVIHQALVIVIAKLFF